MPQELEVLCAALQKQGLRLTQPRIAILTVLLSMGHGPYTVEEIFNHLHKKNNKLKNTKCDLATVYRFISQLEELEILKRCDFGDGIARYEMSFLDESHSLHHHHHLICKVCQKIEILEGCFLNPFEDAILAKGFTSVSHKLEFFGVCARCQSS